MPWLASVVKLILKFYQTLVSCMWSVWESGCHKFISVIFRSEHASYLSFLMHSQISWRQVTFMGGDFVLNYWFLKILTCCKEKTVS